MAHESVKETDVERVEPRLVDRQPDRNVPCRTGQKAGLPAVKAKTIQMLLIAPDNTGIPFRNRIGQWSTEMFRRHELSPVNVKTDRNRAGFYGNLISGKNVS